jgi:CRISPR-associated protein Csh1
MLSSIVKLGALVGSTKKSISGYLFAIVLDENKTFKNVEIEEFQNIKIERYLYKAGESKGNKPAPIAPVTDVEKTFKKIKSWIDTSIKIPDLTDDEKKLIKSISDTLENNGQKITDSIQNKISEISKKESKFLTIKFNNGQKYLGDYEVFQKAYKHLSLQKIQKLSAENKVCSICGETKANVSARTSVYNFDTDDKPGFISEFNKENFWKNIPVCQDCRELLERGKEFIDFKLTFKFYGLKYQLIPKTLLDDNETIKEVIDILSDSQKAISLKERTIKRLTNDEDEILEYISEKGDRDVISLNFLFLQTKQSAERILLLIEDVLPSRIRKIFEAKEIVDSIYCEEFNFGKIRTFFSKSDDDKRNPDLDKYFLEIVDSVFKGKRLDFSFLTKFFMQYIRKEFITDQYYLTRAKDAMMCTSFFEKLGLINFEEEEMEENIFKEIFAKYGKSLSTPAKRGIFLLGVLTQMLLKKQYSDRNSKPFMKKLKSLKMDEKDIKALLPEVMNKLEEYDSFDKGKRIIAQEASRYLLEAGDNWKMSIDEINYYFACGMNMLEEVAKVVYDKGEVGKNE